MCLRQSHFLENAGGGLRPGQYPSFEGTSAWFRLIRHKKGAYTFIERVSNRSGAPWSG